MANLEGTLEVRQTSLIDRAKDGAVQTFYQYKLRGMSDDGEIEVEVKLKSAEERAEYAAGAPLRVNITQ